MRIQQPLTQRLSPYDRIVARVSINIAEEQLTPHPSTLRWSYQVPDGQKLYIESLYLYIRRMSRATTAGPMSIEVSYYPGGTNGVVIFSLSMLTNTLYDDKYLYVTDVGTLFSGDIIACYTQDYSIDGSGLYRATLRGFTYQA